VGLNEVDHHTEYDDGDDDREDTLTEGTTRRDFMKSVLAGAASAPFLAVGAKGA